MLVQSNFGVMRSLRIDGAPVGEILEPELRVGRAPAAQRRLDHLRGRHRRARCCPSQITRLCKRAALGIGRVGSFAAHGSGEIIVGFSTANKVPRAHHRA